MALRADFVWLARSAPAYVDPQLDSAEWTVARQRDASASSRCATISGVFDPHRTTLIDLRDGDTLASLVQAGESEFIERKVAEPKVGFGPTVSAFANTDGGWLLLGVADEADPTGATVDDFTPHGRAHLQDWLRDKLGNQLGVVPPFRAQTVEYGGRQIGVVRVPPSSAGPHFMQDGRVYVRENGRSVVVNTRAQLDGVYARSATSTEDARSRLATRGVAPATESALGMPRPSSALHGQTMYLIVRAAPVRVPMNFGRWVTSRPAVERSVRTASDIGAVLPRGFRSAGAGPTSQLTHTGHVAQIEIDERWWQGVQVAADAAGVVGVRISGTNHDNYFILIEEELRKHLAPALTHLVHALEDSDALGPAVVDLTLAGATNISPFIAGQTGSFPPGANWFETSAELSLPASDTEIDSLLDQLIVDLARAAGITIYSDDPR